MDLISVIIPTGDAKSATFQRTVDSIRGQIYPALEIVPVEGPNPQVNRNTATRLSRGTLLFFCDDDVTLRQDCLSELYSALMDDEKACYAYCDYSRSGAITGVFKSRPFDAEALKRVNYISTMSLIYKRDFLEVGGCNPEVRRLTDWDLWLSLLERNKIGVYVPTVLFNAYYSHKGCVSTGTAFSDTGMSDYQKAVATVRELHPLLFPVVELR